MTKNELIETIGDEAGKAGIKLSKKQLQKIYDIQASVIAKALALEGKADVPGIVRLAIVETKPRMGRNPATGAAISIPAKKKVKAIATKGFDDAVWFYEAENKEARHD